MAQKEVNVLIIIPARGGSKGIPRKNLRSLAGRPLISYAIQNALSSRFNPDVFVSSDDEEIISISKKLGVRAVKRSHVDSKDDVTLDPVIFKAFQYAEKLEGKDYHFIVTLQPTSPLLKISSLDNALEKIINNIEIDTIISGYDDAHLSWKMEGGKYVPNYAKRLNRQQLPGDFKETGGFLITRANVITEKARIGANVDLFMLNEREKIDIDTYADWNLCEFYLKRKRIVFVISGYKAIGLGHVYNSLLVANDILEHEVVFLVDNKSLLAFEKIQSKNYNVVMQKHINIVDDVKQLDPDVVINDRLDCSRGYVRSLKDMGCKVVNFEDLGDGAKEADLTVNAIYPEDKVLPNHYFGHKYFVLRDEFLLTKPRKTRRELVKVLLSFGGVDPNNFTEKVLQAIYPESLTKGITIQVVTGFGYGHLGSLEPYAGIEVFKNVMNISDYMKDADLIFTSAGRTVYEVASLHVPAVVLAQNERELTHFFANTEHGFINMGLGSNVEIEQIKEAYLSLVENYEQRRYMSSLMGQCDLTQGRKIVVKLIKQVISE